MVLYDAKPIENHYSSVMIGRGHYRVALKLFAIIQKNYLVGFSLFLFFSLKSLTVVSV